ncbi:hypothetical protein [Corynebacterium marquesiae]|uniref:hypothetical protein n=1 Tax=Corynebacterium marquesiae TaxID=2913503 RepID=UPI0032EEAD86
MSQRIVAALTAAALGLSAPVVYAAEPQWESSAPESLAINDPSCMPSGDITEPVVLLHGTSNNASVWGNWSTSWKIGGVRVGL